MRERHALEQAWFALWQRGVKKPSQMVIAEARDQGNLAGRWPWLLQSSRGVVSMDAIGAEAFGLPGMGMWAEDGKSQPIMAAMIESLLERPPTPLDWLRIWGVSAGDCGLEGLRHVVSPGTRWEWREEQFLLASRLRLRPGPEGGHVWPLSLRQAAKAASAAFQSGHVALDVGDGAPTHILANLQKVFALEEAKSGQRTSSVDRRFPSNSPLEALQSVSWESLPDDPEAERVLEAGCLQVPLLLWNSKPVAGAVVQLCERSMRVHSIRCASDQPRPSLVWLLNWALAHYAIAKGFRSIEYAAMLLDEVNDLRCEKIFSTRISIRSNGVMRRIQSAMQATAREVTRSLRQDAIRQKPRRRRHESRDLEMP